VDGIDDLNSTRLEQVGKLTNRVLSLRHRKSVTRDDDHLVRIGEQDRDVFCARRADAAVVSPSAPPVAVMTEPKALKRMFGSERPIARSSSGEERARGTYERAGNDEHDRVQHEAAGSDSETGERVQQRDENRYVRSADRQDERDAEAKASTRTIATNQLKELTQT